MKLKLFLFVFTAFLINSCKKDGNGCWQAFDPLGYDALGLIICDKTKAEAEAAHPQFWFYKQGEKKHCWKVQVVGRIYYAWGIPESMAEKQMQENGAYQFTKVDCNSFCTLEWHEKHKGKLTIQFGPTRVITETIVSTDSCSKLSIGKVVVVRETADSLITKELVKKYP